MSRRTIPVLLLAAVLIGPTAGGFLNPTDPWERTAKIRDSNPEWQDAFGATVAVDGDTMLVGHPLEDDEASPAGVNVGAISVYEKENGDWIQQTTIYGPEPKSRFGSVIALDGDTFVANAPGQFTGNGTDYWCQFSTAELYVYERIAGTWQQTTILQPRDHEAWDSCLAGFNKSPALALDEDLLVAGSFYSHGEATVYERQHGEWIHTATLTVDAQPHFKPFGSAVTASAHADRIAVGQPMTDGSPAVRIYEKPDDRWTRTATLHGCCQWMGAALAMNHRGDILVAAAANSDEAPVQIWNQTATGWDLTAHLQPQDLNDRTPEISDLDLNAHGDQLAVGAWLDDVTPSLVPEIRSHVPLGLGTIRSAALPQETASPFGNGAAYVFQNDNAGGWEQTAKIMPQDEVGMNFFGWDVSLDADRLAVGAPGDHGALTDVDDDESTGATYVFERGKLVGPPSSVR